MSNLITDYTQNSSGAITTLNGSGITQTVQVNGANPVISTTTDNISPAIIPSVPLSQLPLNSSPAGGANANPNSRGVNDISDGITANSINLPMRGEKRFIPTVVDTGLLEVAFGESNSKDFFIYANTEAKRLQNGVDYIKIRLPHRGVNPNTQLSDPTQAAEFRFNVNPHTMMVNRQTVDSQSFTRGGWQFGVWGEDAFIVQVQGTSAGGYFSDGLTDEFSYYSMSFRNLLQLQQLFENNGYWFEGEEADEGPLAADYLRRRIRMHQDVELWCGNFIWSGMFDSFTVAQDATQPFMLNFTFSFFVWKERFRAGSPYWGSIQNNVQRGHSYDAVEGQTNNIASNNVLSQYAPSAVASQGTQMANSLATTTNSPYSNNPAVKSSNADDLLQPTPTLLTDQIGLEPLQQLALPNNPVNSAIWSGVSNPPNGGQVLDINSKE